MDHQQVMEWLQRASATPSHPVVCLRIRKVSISIPTALSLVARHRYGTRRPHGAIRHPGKEVGY